MLRTTRPRRFALSEKATFENEECRLIGLLRHLKLPIRFDADDVLSGLEISAWTMLFIGLSSLKTIDTACLI